MPKASSLLAALALFLTLPSPASAELWLKAPDKQKHLAVFFVAGFLTEGVLQNEVPNPWARFAIAMAPGVLKELDDSRQPGNRFDVKDLAANAIGVYLGQQGMRVILRRNFVGFQTEF